MSKNRKNSTRSNTPKNEGTQSEKRFSLKLNENQLALFSYGPHKKKSFFTAWLVKNIKLVYWVENLSIIVFALYAIVFDIRLLLLLPLLGAIVYFRVFPKFLYHWLKVFVFKRSYYEHRRRLYKMGTLHMYIKHWTSRSFNIKKKFTGKIIIWAPTEKNVSRRFKDLNKKDALEFKEYITLKD